MRAAVWHTALSLGAKERKRVCVCVRERERERERENVAFNSVGIKA